MSMPPPSSTTSLVKAGGAKRPPGVSLNNQVVIDEDDYTAAMSHIIKRDFFPSLPRLAATNEYLSALESQDSARLSSSLRQLSALSTPGAGSSTAARRREREASERGTPYISRTPFGGAEADWDTPAPMSRRDEEDEESGRKRIDTSKGLDDFQHAYTSEDNSSFISILTEENARRREKYAWAFEAEEKAKAQRLRLEQTRRQGLIDAGGYVPDDGLMPKRITAGREVRGVLALKEKGEDKDVEKEHPVERVGERREVEAGTKWKGKGKAVGRGDVDDDGDTEMTATDLSNSLITTSSATTSTTTALIRRPPPEPSLDPSTSQLTVANAPPTTTAVVNADEDFIDILLEPSSHLALALSSAGLPETAVVDRQGEVVPMSGEMALGTGGRVEMGEEWRKRREEAEKSVMESERDTRGNVVPAWGYKTRNALMFPPDADVSPLVSDKPPNAPEPPSIRQAPPQILHANTRMPEDDEDEAGGSRGGSKRGTSPSRSRVGAAISGTPYRPADTMPTFNNYPLVPEVPSPSPSQMGPQAIADMMTWGTLLATPRALPASGVDLSGPTPFRMLEPGSRDHLGRKLAGDAARAMRERAKGYGGAPRGLAVLSSDTMREHAGSRSTRGSMGPPGTPGSVSGSATPKRRIESLTPAGRTLLERTAGSPYISRGGGLGLPTSGRAGGGAAGRSRSEAMEKSGGWGDLGMGRRERRKPAAERTWTPSPAPVRRGD